MSDYISRVDLLNAFGLSEKTRKYGGDHSGYDSLMLYEIQDTIEDMESADVRENIHGEWINTMNGRFCGNCGADSTAKYNFCPNCGADMRTYKGYTVSNEYVDYQDRVGADMRGDI